MATPVLLYWDYRLGWGEKDACASSLAQNESEATARLLARLQALGVRSTFAVLARCVVETAGLQSNPQQVQQMAQQGHEIASCGFSGEDFSQLSQVKLLAVLSRSRFSLEKVIKNPVVSFVASPRRFPIQANWLRRRMITGLADQAFLTAALSDTGFRTALIQSDAAGVYTPNSLWRRKPSVDGGFYRDGKITLIPNDFPAGFAEATRQRLDQRIESGRPLVVWGRPGHLLGDGEESWKHFEPLLEALCSLRDSGRITFSCVRDLDIGRNAVALRRSILAKMPQQLNL